MSDSDSFLTELAEDLMRSDIKIKTADQLADSHTILKCMGCEATNNPGDPNETSAPFYEVIIWNDTMTEFEKEKEIHCSECLSNILTEESELVYSMKQIWISDYEIQLRRD